MNLSRSAAKPENEKGQRGLSQAGVPPPELLDVRPTTSSIALGLAFYTIQQTTKLYAYDVSEASPFALLLFGSAPKFLEMTQSLQARALIFGHSRSARESCLRGHGRSPEVTSLT